MATKASRTAARMMMAPAVIVLLGWMLVPLIMTLWFSFRNYLPLRGGDLGFAGFDNYVRFITSSAFWPAVLATLTIVLGTLIITVVLGVLLALLLDQPMWGQGIVRILVIAPFFVMPTVSGLVWKNMFLDSVNGLFAHAARAIGVTPVEWIIEAPFFSIILITSWTWLPFATLILLTAIQSLDSEQLDAAEMDGAPKIKRFWYIIVPHMSRAITVVILIQTIFLLSVFAEIFVTTAGAFGSKTLTYLIYQRVLESQNIGLGSAGGVYAIILANIVAVFLMRIVGKNLDA
ncbi:sorbitol ABC transporter membrane protein /mannitol ABC transporter membrane protein [Pseudorhodobacter antarcticus]|jgi:sorbitol/mannitol transport system permease protein|uniref:Sorbitol ABC transporter membrane protein /mannitol ABC transporter membrane protein n=1 Tax=Pseudorhodobacter antarcticus TaxID=1077947 RepID=A0A1H8HAF3_9RHOB|nr:sugar ABC transporter permease [Pseudorhodobacter antarcticus]SEN53212.1 sorbitol ABC transporter membrane protein /mannitol ABC transporter membrane protein [Pseudorhodobacter antarcticus]